LLNSSLLFLFRLGSIYAAPDAQQEEAAAAATAAQDIVHCQYADWLYMFAI
jgi:hypothetical protein